MGEVFFGFLRFFFCLLIFLIKGFEFFLVMVMERKMVVVIGGGVVGMSIVLCVKRLKFEWDVKVFEVMEWVSYVLCGIFYVVEGILFKEKFMYYFFEVFIKKCGIDFYLKVEVIEVE